MSEDNGAPPERETPGPVVSPWMNLFALWLTVAGVWKTFETLIVILRWILIR